MAEPFQKAQVQIERVSSKLWFLDLKFTQFVTPKLIGFVWGIYLIVIALATLITIFTCLGNLTALRALGAIILLLIGVVLSVLFTRVILEMFLVTFRVAERLEPLKYLENLQNLKGPTS